MSASASLSKCARELIPAGLSETSASLGPPSLGSPEARSIWSSKTPRTDFGRAAEYAVLRELIDPLAALGAPVYLMPGNHDDRDALRRSFPEHRYLGEGAFVQYAVDVGPLRLLALDTCVHQRSDGLTQLRILELDTDGIAEDHLVGFDDEVYTIGSGGNPEFEQPVVRFGYTTLASFAGLPAISFPVGRCGVPVAPLAMQLVGPRHSERSLIGLADAAARRLDLPEPRLR